MRARILVGAVIFSFRIVSYFNTVKTLTLSVHAGLFGCLYSPLHSDMDYYGIFNVRRLSFCLHIHTGSHPKDV